MEFIKSQTKYSFWATVKSFHNTIPYHMFRLPFRAEDKLTTRLPVTMDTKRCGCWQHYALTVGFKRPASLRVRQMNTAYSVRASQHWPDRTCRFTAWTRYHHLDQRIVICPGLYILFPPPAPPHPSRGNDRMSSASVFSFGRSGNPNLVGSNPGHVESIT